MTTKTVSLRVLALLLVGCNLLAPPQKSKIQAKNLEATQKSTLNPSKRAQDAFTVAGAHQAIIKQQKPVKPKKTAPKTVPAPAQPQLPGTNITFKKPLLTERYTQPMKFTYNLKTQEFEAQPTVITPLNTEKT